VQLCQQQIPEGVNGVALVGCVALTGAEVPTMGHEEERKVEKDGWKLQGTCPKGCVFPVVTLLV